MKESLDEMKFVNPTPIQASAIPAGLEGRDIVGTAETGTGKTAAFGIPLLASLCSKPGVQGLVLAPTRELAAQIHQVLSTLGRKADLVGSLVVGGESFRRQADEMRRGVDFIVATPGRLNDHLQYRTARLDKVGVLVLDEVDRMLDMGFLPQIKDVLRHTPKERQTMLFSATLPREVTQFIDPLVQDPVRVAINDVKKANNLVKEDVIRTQPQLKTGLLLKHLQATTGKVLVFVRTKSRTARVVRSLENSGYKVVSLHGGRTQSQRVQALERFRSGTHPIMIATDLAGRGLDVKDIDHVVNFDVPATREDYIHRIGRTGRAGNTGTATSFLIEGDRDEERVVFGKVDQKFGKHRGQMEPRRPRFSTPDAPPPEQIQQDPREERNAVQNHFGRRTHRRGPAHQGDRRAQGLGGRRQGGDSRSRSGEGSSRPGGFGMGRHPNRGRAKAVGR